MGALMDDLDANAAPEPQPAGARAQKRRKKVLGSYEDLAKRGEKLVTSVRRCAYTRRAVDQAKSARSQVKAAATSVRKTASATTEAQGELIDQLDRFHHRPEIVVAVGSAVKDPQDQVDLRGGQDANVSLARL